jgi:hypothetical protein
MLGACPRRPHVLRREGRPDTPTVRTLRPSETRPDTQTTLSSAKNPRQLDLRDEVRFGTERALRQVSAPIGTEGANPAKSLHPGDLVREGFANVVGNLCARAPTSGLRRLPGRPEPE